MYTIKAVTSLTGLTSESLRAWEKRYAVVTPERDTKGRRVYSQQEVERLSLLYSVTQQGFAISKIANLDNADLQNLLAANSATETGQQDLFFLKVVDALVEYRFDRCEDLLRRALVAMEPLTYAQEILLPTLQKVGSLWHEGRISIAQEHLFSACVKRLVLSMVNSMPAYSHRGPTLLFATITGEDHEFGILLSRLVAAQQQCKAYYLGTGLPWNELLNACAKLQATVVVSSCVNTPPTEAMLNELNLLADAIPDPIDIWIGGAGAQYLSNKQLLPANFQFINNLDNFNSRLLSLILESQ